MKATEENIEAAWQRSRGEKEYDPGYPVKASSNFIDGFKAGAEWALSQQWISVDDALPEMYERVLAFRAFPKRSVFISKRIPHDITDPASDRWHWSNMVNDSEIRYWMPLPQMPKAIE